MHFSDYRGQGVTAPHFTHACGKPECMGGHTRAESGDIDIGLCAVTANGFLRMPLDAMIEEPVAGEVIVNADKVRRAGRGLQLSQMFRIDISVEEAPKERMARVYMPTKQIHG
ncbi:hypothetical protein MesoLj113b_73600 (plasmid) [Mesorhizobium sp. 113-3-3]|nr:hypothetical protein MesoLj113b_73600 [Mesorhizobium sp. 113-3-3]